MLSKFRLKRFDGTNVLTAGFKYAPEDIEHLRPGACPKVLRNRVHLAIVLNGPMLIACALLTPSTITSGASVLSLFSLLALGPCR